MRRYWWLLLLTTAIALAAFGEQPTTPGFGVHLYPRVDMPVGRKSPYYGAGYGASIAGSAHLPRLPVLAPRVDLSFVQIALPSVSDSQLASFDLQLGLSAVTAISPRLVGYATVGAGAYLARLDLPQPVSSAHLAVNAGAGVTYQFADGFSIGAQAVFRSYAGTFESLSIAVGSSLRLAGSSGGLVPLARAAAPAPNRLPDSGLIEVRDARLETVFPVLWKYYDTHPVGSATIENTSRFDLKNVEVRVRPGDYADGAKLSARIESLPAGEQAIVDLYVLLNEEVLTVTEGTRVSTDLEVAYRVGDAVRQDVETVTLATYDRNSLVWDDNEKIAAFVTARDEEIQRLGRAALSAAPLRLRGAVSEDLRRAMIVFEALGTLGLSYVVDPGSPYAELSENPNAIDYVLFPRQTLYVGAGDCDDLSVVYASLLESIGISTAFVMIPGHVFPAFRIGTLGDGQRIPLAESDLIVRDDGSVWVPVEATLLSEGFLEAWSAGARQWRRFSMSDEAQLVETQRAWRTFAPVALPGADYPLPQISDNTVRTRYSHAIDAYVAREIELLESTYLEGLASQPQDDRLLNRLGILYARYGLYDQAMSWFEQATESGRYAPAFVNRGHGHLILGYDDAAQEMYRQALSIDPDNRHASAALDRLQSGDQAAIAERTVSGLHAQSRSDDLAGVTVQWQENE